MHVCLTATTLIRTEGHRAILESLYGPEIFDVPMSQIPKDTRLGDMVYLHIGTTLPEPPRQPPVCPRLRDAIVAGTTSHARITHLATQRFFEHIETVAKCRGSRCGDWRLMDAGTYEHTPGEPDRIVVPPSGICVQDRHSTTIPWRDSACDFEEE